jgi:catechol 2,3-dioxygenase-like lactoylglutathione lyase family enzyme
MHFHPVALRPFSEIAQKLPSISIIPGKSLPVVSARQILFALKTGIPWEYLPPEMGCGKRDDVLAQAARLVPSGRLAQAAPGASRRAGPSRSHRLGPGRAGLRRSAGPAAAHGLCYTRDMTIKRLDHVSVVVDDLAAAIAFFTALGMTLEGEMPVEGPWVDRVNGLESVQVDIVMMRTPDGHGRLELTKFRNPKLVEIEPAIAPPNTLGLRSVMFTVESVDDTVARLRANGAELVGEVAQYEDKYRLCYMRGPAGIIVALAEELF